MDSLKSLIIYAGTIGTIFSFRRSIAIAPDNPLSTFLLGIVASHFCVYVLPLRYNLLNPWVAEFTRRRVETAKKSKSKNAQKLGSYEQWDMYGLEHSFMNLDLECETMWENVGYWKNAGGSFPKACADLFEELLKASGALNDGPVNILEVGCGCAEAPLHLLKSKPDSFRSYVGLNINKTQAEFCQTRLQSWENTHIEEKAASPRTLRVFNANAALPSTWSKDLTGAVDLITKPGGEGDSKTWMLALDTLYHFRQGREQILTHASQTLGLPLMATDFILQDKLSFSQRWGLWATLEGIQVPWSNRTTKKQYIEMLVRCGYERESIKIIDVSKHVFGDYADFLSARREKWDEVGGSLAFAAPFTLFRWCLRYWAYAGTISESLIVAHPKKQ